MNLEHQAAVAFNNWWLVYAYCKKLHPALLYAIPNAGAGAQRGQAGKMKAEGVRRGIPDYCLAIPRGGFPGLYLELKRGGPGIPKGQLSPEQMDVIQVFKDQGYKVVVAYGALEAENAVEKYLEPEANKKP